MRRSTRHPFPRAARLALAVPAAGAIANCDPAGNAVQFSVDFANAALRERARLVQVELRRGGCTGQTVFTTDVTREREGSAPGALAPGRYGFSARARDSACLWFATGCSEATLPSNTSLTVVLNETTAVLDAGCTPGADDPDAATSEDGSSSTASDAGGDGATGDGATGDGATGDGSTGDGSTGDGSAQGDAGSDAGGGFDPTAPKCEALGADVVACFDFDGDLNDASQYGNDATGSGARFETGLSGQAMRPRGTTVAVADDASLNFSGDFTIEMWLRADSLMNLAGDATGITLLLDKDQQYDLGFFPTGDVAGEVYSVAGMAEDTNADATDIRVGAFTYIAWTYAAGRTTLYQDGVLAEGETLGYAPFTGQGGAMHIGSGSPNTTRAFDGVIDALRMWNRALDQDEICAAAGRQFTTGTCL